MPVARHTAWMRWALTPVLMVAAAMPFHAAGTTASAADMRHPFAGPVSPLLLTLGDVQTAYGSGFALVSSREITNRMAAGTSAGVVPGTGSLLTGRITGYVASYLRIRYAARGGQATVSPGVTTVSSGVNLYKASRYAQGALAYGMQQAGTRQPKGLTVHLSHLSGVGDAALLEVSRPAAGLRSNYLVLIAFQRGRYMSTVDVGAYGKQPTTATVLNLARLVDGRIRSHLAGLLYEVD